MLMLGLAGCAVVSPDVPAPGPPEVSTAQASPVPQAPGRSGIAPAAAAASAAAAELEAAQLQQRFAAWLGGVRTQARAAGITEATLAALNGVHYLPRVVNQDGAQAEFTRSVWAYLDSAVSARRIATGQAKLAELQAQTQAAQVRYGVPPSIVMAIWGMESNYGSHYGDIPTLDALSTLGFDGRREAWARGQLLAALTILQNGDIDAGHLIGSWAGAMGQTQFLPTAFLAYAVDADGDGRRDIWGSMADVVASTANFLAQSGWQAGQPWGVEVQLPPGFDYARADAAVRQGSDQWAAEGVTGLGGAALPALAQASLLLPAGSRGPAFLVGANFRVILRYNNATAYALAVGLLAQQIDGGPGVQTAWPRDLAMLSRSQLTDLQTALNQRGFSSGTPDGVMGPATRSAVRRYQQSLGLPADGYPDLDLLLRLQPP